MGKTKKVITEMKQTRTDVERFEGSSSKHRRLLREEELILDVTELLSSALQDKQMTKSELAEKLGRTKGFVTQVLSGNRNLTLRTIADIADALGYRVRMMKEQVSVVAKHADRFNDVKVFHWANAGIGFSHVRDPYRYLTSRTKPEARGTSDGDQLAA
jgi:transcriptional regulator with XRE-family HTH domain